MSKANKFKTVVSGAFFTEPKKKSEEATGKMLLKLDNGKTEEIVGLFFNDAYAVESCISALNRIKNEMKGIEKLHPGMQLPSDSNLQH